MIGYDIDGVLATGIKPKRPYVVVSGRLVDEWGRISVRLLGRKETK